MPHTEKQKQIEEQRKEKQLTRRVVSPDLEEILYEALPVLDHGFVRVIDYMGIDASIVQAARVSYGKGTKHRTEDAGLIKYLMRHRHTTPFEMCEIKFHIKLPMFVARQWIRHRTANVNEYSARYSILENEFYIPKAEHLAAQSLSNRQGRGSVLEGEEAQRALFLLKRDAAQCYETYRELLNEDDEGNILNEEKSGLARELSRMNLPVNCYTQWYWKVDLHNLMHFLSLRADPTAQYEIRAYADVMIGILQKWLPITYDAFVEYRLESASISRKGLKAIRKMLRGETVDPKEEGISPREWQEIMEKISPKT